MSLQLTQKERTLLEDQKSHEEICIKKYTNYAEQAQDQQLKQLFKQYASEEQNHYNTIDQMLQGKEPNLSGGQQQSQPNKNQNQAQQNAGGMTNQEDKVLCTDMLMAEKYVSHTYDTVIFEAVSAPVRQALQHIQREEQKHGEGIFNYMQQHGMYNPK